MMTTLLKSCQPRRNGVAVQVKGNIQFDRALFSFREIGMALLQSTRAPEGRYSKGFVVKREFGGASRYAMSLRATYRLDCRLPLLGYILLGDAAWSWKSA